MKSRRRFVRTNVVLSWMLAVQQVFANPVGEAIVGGSATLDRSHPGKLVIHQGSDRLIINWRDFSIGRGEVTKFIQPSQTSIALNRVMAGNPTKIYGSLEANGIVYVINPNGILVGPGGTINARSFIGSTLDAPDDSFMKGAKLTLSGNSGAAIVNQGKIEAIGGDVFLVARTVENSGTIRAGSGTVGLAAGNEVMIVPSGEQRISVIAGAGQGGVGVNNRGTIEAVTAELKAAGGNIYALAINNGGIVRATGVRSENGRVFLTSDGGDINHAGTITANNADGSGGSVVLSAGHALNNEATVISTGTIQARGETPGSRGGEVKILGDRVGLLGEAVVDVSGDTGGGEALIGGDFQGRNAEVQNAKRTSVGSDVVLRADAGSQGDGGKVIVWADEVTRFAGNISARGGANGGNGGFAEVSGKENLLFVGTVDLSSPVGLLGTLLLDPDNITITDTDDGTGTLDDELTPNGDPSLVFGDADDGANTVSSGQLEAFGDAANIILSANDNITIDDLGGDQTLNLAAITGSILFTADADNDGTGGFSMNAGDTIRTQGGDVTITGVGISVGSIVTTPSTAVNGGAVSITSHGGGDVTVNGAITTTGGAVVPDNNGRAGGNVTINSAGALTVNAITTSGSAGADDGPGPLNRDGGAAGNIALTGGTGITLLDDIIATGGAAAGAGTAGTAGTLTLTATAGGVNQSAGALDLRTLTLAGAGAFTLNQAANDIANLSANVDGAIIYRDANALSLINGVVSANNPISIATVNGALTVDNDIAGADVDAGTSTLSLTAGSTRAAAVNQNDHSLILNGGLLGTGGITLVADNMDLSPDASGIDAGTATITLRSAEAGTEISLRDTDAANRLGLSATELGTITAGGFAFGDSSAGNIQVLDDVNFGAADFSLLTGGDILFSSGATLTSTGDATLTAGLNISGAGSGVHVDADVVTLQTTGAGDIGSSGTPFFVNGNSLVAVTDGAAGSDIFVREENGLSGLNVNAGAGNLILVLDAGGVADSDGAVDIAAAAASVTLADGAVQTFGALANRIQTSVGDLSVVTLAGGSQFIEEANGLTGLHLNAGPGNVNLVITAGALVDQDAAADITAANALLTLGDVTAQNVGSLANRIGTSVDSLTVDTSAGGGSQFMEEANGLTALNLNAGLGDVNLSLTAGTLTDADIGADITAASATLVGAGSIGTLGSRILTSVDNLSVNTSSGNANQFLSEANGLTALNLNSGSGNIDLNLLAGSIVDTDVADDLTAGAAFVSLNGIFGTAGNRIGTSVGGLTIDTSLGNGNQFITEANGLTSLSLNAGNGQVDLGLTAGSVTDADGGTDITAGTAIVTLASGTAQDFGTSGNRINTSVDNLSVDTSAGGGSQFISEANGLAAINLNAGAGDVDLTLLLGNLQDADLANDITANEATILLSDVAVQNVGSFVSPLQTSVDSLAANTSAGNGSQDIDEANGLTGLNLVLGTGNATLELTAGSVLDSDASSDITSDGTITVTVNGPASIGSAANPLGIGGSAGSATLAAIGGGVHVDANAALGDDIHFTSSGDFGAQITTAFTQGGKAYSATYADAVGGDLTVRGDGGISSDLGVTVLARQGTLTLDVASQIGGGVGTPFLIDAGILNAFSGGNEISIHDTSGGLALSRVDAGGAAVNLSAQGGGLTSASVDGTADLIGGLVNLSVTGGGSRIGTDAASPLEINASTLTAVNDGAAGSGIFVLDTAGGFSIANVNAGSGEVNLAALNGSLTSALVDGTADVIGNSVTLSVTGAGNDIGSSPASRLEINATTVNASTAGALGDDIFLVDTSSGLAAGLVTAGAGAVDLSVLNGSLTSTAVDTTADIVGGIVTLGVTGSGLLGQDSANRLEVDGVTLNASTAGGNDIFLVDTAGGVAVGTVNAGTGDVSLRANDGSLTSATVDGTADIIGDIVNLDVTGAGNDIGVSAASRLEINAVTLNASSGGTLGDDIFVLDTVDGIEAGLVNAGTAGNVNIRAVGGGVSSSVFNSVADVVGNIVTLEASGAGNDVIVEIDANVINASTDGVLGDDVFLLDTAGGLAVGLIDAGLGTVGITARDGNLTSQTVDGVADIIGDRVTLGTEGAGTRIGDSAANRLEIDATTLAAQSGRGADDDVSIVDTAGGLAVEFVDAGQGNVNLEAADGDITSSFVDGSADIFGDRVNLSTTGSGDIGSISQPVEFNATRFSADAVGTVSVLDTAGGLAVDNVTSDSGAVWIRMDGGVMDLNGTITAGVNRNIVLSAEGSGNLKNSGVTLDVSGTGRFFIYSTSPDLNSPEIFKIGNALRWDDLEIDRVEFNRTLAGSPPDLFPDDGANRFIFLSPEGGEFDELNKFFGDFLPVEDYRAVSISFGQYDPTKFGEVGDIWLSSSELYEEQRKAGKAPRLAPEKVERLKFVIGGQ